MIARNARLRFAYRTFPWKNKLSHEAAVHIIILGFVAFKERGKPVIYEHTDVGVVQRVVSHINGYLIEAEDVFVSRRSMPFGSAPKMLFGNKATDNGNLIYTAAEKRDFVQLEPASVKYLRRYMGSSEFLKNIERWCLWLVDTPPSEIKSMRLVYQRISDVREFRLKSTSSATRSDPPTPQLFVQVVQPTTDYSLIPRVSSGKREYIPMGFFRPEVIVNAQAYFIADTTLYEFGVLHSSIFMTCVRIIVGRMKSDYQMSNFVYDSFP